MKMARNFISDSAKNEAILFYLWGHTFEFEADNNWHVIEEFCDYIGNREDIWYATNIEIYDYVQAYNRLVFSADAKQCITPPQPRFSLTPTAE